MFPKVWCGAPHGRRMLLPMRVAGARSSRRVSSTGFGLAAIFSIAAQQLFSQQVSGTARTAGSQIPVVGTAIVLVSGTGVIVAGTLSGPDGQYSLRAPGIGRFKVRARHIGFSPDSSQELSFDNGRELHFDPALTALRTTLQVVKVQGSQRCEVSPEAGATAFDLWEAAQNALSATIAAAGGNGLTFRLQRFQRELDPATARVIQGTESHVRALSSEPYYSVSPDSLAKMGFARTEGDSSVYYAPDARTLTSEVFAQTHCLHATEDPAKPGEVGLAFEPVRHNRLVDVSGVLWFDRASSVLRDLEFKYEMPASHQGAVLPRGAQSATGHIKYSRLDNGVWIVDSWIIRVPVQIQESGNTVSTNGGVSNLTIRSSPRARTTAIWEIGGQVAAVLKPGDPSLVSDERYGAVDGSVEGGPNRLPMIGAEIALSSPDTTLPSRTMRTAAKGLFAFDSLPQGEYVLNVTEISFDTLNIKVAPVRLNVHPGTKQTIAISLPAPEEGRSLLCKGDNSSRSIILHGTVTDSATGKPIVRARVVASWLTGVGRIGPNGGGIAAAAHERDTFTDSDGRYVFCDIEVTAHLLVGASIGERKSPRAPSLTLEEGGIYMVNLRVSR
jgi:Carboxypeptidase regulatory-like domain